MTSPPGVPQTATSDATTIPYTLASEISQPGNYAASQGTTMGKDDGSSVKGKSGAYPRPSVTPAEYTQQQQQLNKHSPATLASITRSGKPFVEADSLAQRQSGPRGPLKVVNTTPRPESIAAFQKQSQGASPLNSAGGKKVTGFAVRDAWSTTDVRKRDDDAVGSGSTGQGKESIPENSKWNVLRSTLRRGMSFGEKPVTLDSPSVSGSDVGQRSAPLMVAAHRGRDVDRDSLEQLQDQLTAGSTEKMQFFERYKKMADRSASSPGVMARSLSNRSMDSPAELKVRAELLGSLLGEAAAVESPSMARLEEAYMDDNGADVFQPRRHDSDRSNTLCPNVVTTTAGRKTPSGPRRPSGSRSTHVQRIPENGSISSIDSAQAEKIRMAEADLLTPSTSMDRLAEITSGSKHGGSSQNKAFPGDKEHDTIEGLIDKPIETPLDLEFDQMFSPNLSQATSGQSYRFRRASAASSLLAPSDSISTPGVNDKYHIDYTATAAVQARIKPGSKACQKCGQSLRGKRFIERDGMLLCEPDWKEMFLPKVSRGERYVYSNTDDRRSCSAAGARKPSKRPPCLLETASSRGNGIGHASAVTAAQRHSTGTHFTYTMTSRIAKCITTKQSELQSRMS